MEHQLMTTKYFVQKFKLDQENFEFNREEFLKELNNYFLQLIEQSKKESKDTKDGFNYKKFRNCVDQTQQKFWSISNKKHGTPLTENLWSAFFAIYITALRGELFPEVQEAIESKKEKEVVQITEEITDSDLMLKYNYKSPEGNVSLLITRVKPHKQGYKLCDDVLHKEVLLSIAQIEKLMSNGLLRWVDIHTKSSYSLQVATL